jgi:hypothetical protein
MQAPADFIVENHGSLVLVRPISDSCETWLEDHTSGTWFGGALVCEPRYVGDLLEGMTGEGFTALREI